MDKFDEYISKCAKIEKEKFVTPDSYNKRVKSIYKNLSYKNRRLKEVLIVACTIMIIIVGTLSYIWLNKMEALNEYKTSIEDSNTAEVSLTIDENSIKVIYPKLNIETLGKPVNIDIGGEVYKINNKDYKVEGNNYIFEINKFIDKKSDSIILTIFNKEINEYKELKLVRGE